MQKTAAVIAIHSDEDVQLEVMGRRIRREGLREGFRTVPQLKCGARMTAERSH